MKEKILNLMKKKFIRNVIILTSGTAGAQIIGMLLSPVITRLYGPEAYGLMGTFMAMTTIIAPVAALTYPVAIVLPKNDSDAKGIAKLSLLIAIGIAIVLGLILLLFNKQVVSILGIEEISSFMYLIPIVILFAGLLQVIEQWLIRKKKFGVSAKATLSQAIIVNGSKVVIGLFHPVATVLIVFTAIREGLKAALLFLFTNKSNSKFLFSVFKRDVSTKGLAKRYKDFPMYRAPEEFINAISGSLPILLLTSFFGPASAGFYAIGRTVLQMPSQLIGKSVGDVFYPRIAEAAHNDENLTDLIKKATFMLAVLGIIPFGAIILFGPWLFSFVFGADWSTAGEYARWMTLWLYFSFINRPSVRALPVLSAQAFHLIYTVIRLIVRILVLIVGFYIFSSDIVAIALVGIAGAILNLGLIVITMYISKKFDRSKKEITN